MNHPLATLLTALAVGGGTAAAVLDSVPVLTDALTGAGVGAFVGGMVAYRRRLKDSPALGFIPKGKLSGAALAELIG